MKTPNFNTFVQFLYDQNIIKWNPKEHESWELPPSKYLAWFWLLFPVDETNSEVVNFISPASKKRILNFFRDKEL